MDTTCWQYYPSLPSRRIKLYRRQINTVRYTITECNLGGALKTTVLSAILPRCGTGCCPFGFTRNSSGNCVMNANQDIFDDSSSKYIFFDFCSNYCLDFYLDLCFKSGN
ncbi:hypothetical protein NA56DRAFT_702580 [Hyaloscypha hepaticicola]|uniref:Uncharacterized protein n=1 Tax=Hyaloscypha hepaticicola TaxID=2082293 RepID=A0A2J6Q7H5_9HELO|nr:hypothetical protein NA56DRAFT_702580 [Hyaloscypha hepaticicola]